MEKYIYNEQNGLHYELVGDYYLPLLSIPQMPPLGIWGRQRHRYLKEHRPVIYNVMLLSGDLFSHLAEVDQQAKELHDRLLKQMTEQAGINDELKAQNQMAWVQQMNAIDAQVREIEYSAFLEPGVRRVRATIPVGQSRCSGQREPVSFSVQL